MKFLTTPIQNLAVSYAQKAMKDSLYKSLDIDLVDKEIKKVPNPNKKYMLYAHIPFCHTFCPYCSFHKYAYEKDLCKDYFVMLRKEMQAMKDVGYDFDSLYVGGGTTLIDEYELLKTLELAKKLFSIKTISSETDPNHLDPAKLSLFKGVIDRLSVGIQSFDNDILKKVGRYTKFGSNEVLIYKLNKAVGILPMLSLDLIFNLPFQTEQMLLNDIKIAKSISPEQITLYPLMKSPVTRDAIAKSLGSSNIDNEKYFYQLIREEFKDYHNNNAWSFSKVKSELKDEYVSSNHEYVGIGSGAFSFLNGELLINAFNLKDYGSLVKENKSTVIGRCNFTKQERLKYIFLTELFDGNIDMDKFNKSNNSNLKKDLFMEIFLLKLADAIYEKDGKIFATKFGDYLSVVLMKEFYTGMDKVRAIFRDDAKVKSSKKLKVMQDINDLNIIKPLQQ